MPRPQPIQRFAGACPLFAGFALVIAAARACAQGEAYPSGSGPAFVAQPFQWKAQLDLAARNLAPLAGDWLARDAIPGVTWLQVLLGAVAVLIVAVVERFLHALIRRHIRFGAGEAGGTGGRAFVRGTLDAGLKPLTLLISVAGAYAALSILLVDAATIPPAVRAVPDRVLSIGGFAAFLWFLFRLMDVLERELGRWAMRGRSKWDGILATVAGRAFRWITPLMAVLLFLPTLGFSAGSHRFLNEGASVLLILSVGFILAQLVGAVEEGVLRQLQLDAAGNLAARKIQTQVMILKRIAFLVIGIFTMALALMVFAPVRHVGSSMLASAGVASVIIGFAAQRSLGTLVAGFQIAMTQPIRIADVVIVENEWGQIEDITLSYVVVRLWDLRRLVLPITYFIEKPFQNWTRMSSDLLGTVMLYVDYTMPMAPLRAELERILDASPLWDRKAKNLQVIEAKEQVLQLRILVSAADAGRSWDLRCEVRERLVDFLQRNYPQCLPRTRAPAVDTPPSHNNAPAPPDKA